MLCLRFLLFLAFMIMSSVTAKAQNADNFNTTKIYLNLLEATSSLDFLPSHDFALKNLENQPFLEANTPNMKNPHDRFKYYSALGYYTAYGIYDPAAAVFWLQNIPKLNKVGQMGLIIAIHNIGPAPENVALQILFSQIPSLQTQLSRMPRNVLAFPAITLDILATLEGAFLSTARPKYTALIIRGLKESLPKGKRPDAILSHLIPYVLQKQSLSDSKAKKALEVAATHKDFAEIAPLLNAIADNSLIGSDATPDSMSNEETLNEFFKNMTPLIAKIAFKQMGTEAPSQ